MAMIFISREFNHDVTRVKKAARCCRSTLRQVASSRSAFRAGCLDRRDGLDTRVDRRDSKRNGFPGNWGQNARSLEFQESLRLKQRIFCLINVDFKALNRQ